MEESRIRELLNALVKQDLSVDEAVKGLAGLGVETLGHSRVDHHRAVRTGFPEVIFCMGKTPAQVGEIAAALDAAGSRILATRCEPAHFEAAAARVQDLTHQPASRLFHKGLPTRDESAGRVLVVSAGTSDIPVAEEAVWTARMVGVHVETLFDAGVAGIHRLTSQREILDWADAIVVVAGMEGALASVVGGLVRVPVIAVPTSVGYGAAFGGLAALLGMLNSCATGVSVMNIDNGFGAGLAAARYARGLGEAVKRDREAHEQQRS